MFPAIVQKITPNKRAACNVLKATSMTSEYGANLASSAATGLGIFGGQAAAVTAGIAYTAKYRIDTEAFDLGCDDVPFDEIKEMLGERFTKVDKNLDRNYGATQENLLQILENRQLMKHIESKVDETLLTLGQGFEDVDNRFQEVKNGIKELRDLVVSLKINDVTSNLLTLIEDYELKKEGLTDVSDERLLQLLRGEEGIREGYMHYFKSWAREVRFLLNEILRDGYADPENITDKKRFMALILLYEGTRTYIDVFYLLLQGFTYLRIDSFHKSNVDDYNKYFNEFATVVATFRHALCGVGIQMGMIRKVVDQLNRVREKNFIKNEERGTRDVLTKQVRYLEKRNVTLGAMDDFRKREGMVLEVSCDFDNSTVATPFLNWESGTKVRYAVHNGMDDSPIIWSNHHCTVEGKACPRVILHVAPSANDLIVFRQFGNDSPQLVGFIHNQTEFRDIDRDFFDAVSDGNKQLALTKARILIAEKANVSARFEGGKQAIHAAAARGHIDIIKTLIEVGADVNAQDGNGYSPVHEAAKLGKTEVVKVLIEKKADLGVRSHLNWTATHLAASNGQIDTLKVLLAEGNDLNVKATGGFTPLHFAVTSRKTRATEELTFNETVLVNAQSDKLVTPLHLAVLGKDTQTMQILLASNKCDVNLGAIGGLTALHLATTGGNATVVKQLLRHPAIDANVRADDGWTPLHTACSNGLTAVALDLINHGAQLESQERRNYTPLHCAAENGHLDTVSLLLDKKAALEARDERGYTPLGLAVLNGQSRVIIELVENNADVNSRNKKGRSLFEDAVLTNDLDTIDVLEAHGAKYGREVLSLAASTHNWDLVRKLIFRGNTLLEGRTPLHNACELGNIDLVRYLLTMFTDVNMRDGFGDTPLHVAIESGNVEIAQFLIKEKADVNAKDAYDRTPLLLAAHKGQLATVESLTRSGSEIDTPDGVGASPLNVAVRGEHFEIVKHLTERGANVNLKYSVFEFFPLLNAIRPGNLKMVTYLVEHGADITYHDKFLRTPLYVASDKDNEIVEYLVNRGSDTNAKTNYLNTPLHAATSNLKIVKLLLDHGADKTARNNYGDTPLHNAAWLGHTDVADYLAKCHACINSKNLEGLTPLYYAVDYKKPEVVRILVENKADLNAKNNEGETALFAAIRNSDLNMVKYLTKNGADVNAQDRSGDTPLTAAIRRRQHVISTYLESLGAVCRKGCRCVDSWLWGTKVSCDNGRRRRSINPNGVSSRSRRMDLVPISKENVTATSSWPLKMKYVADRQNRHRVSGNNGQAGSAAFGSQVGSLPSFTENVLLARWMLYLFGRKSFVHGMNEAEKITWGESSHESKDSTLWAQRYLREGIERYGGRH